jgi:hypothetical protein
MRVTHVVVDLEAERAGEHGVAVSETPAEAERS